ncbi:sensor histidine kinase [Algivirga pacifica]|uniref:histidine kinase n=1 Tax=Algivirga pacifica TaxID=1162670 RepID=A0ABP9D972_9BACT
MSQSIFSQLIAIGQLPDDEIQMRSRKQLLNSLAIMMSVGGLIWGGIAFAFGEYLIGMIPFGYTIMSFFNLLYFHISKNFKGVRFFQILISLLLPFFFQWGLGGFVASGGVMLWALFSLTGSIAFSEIKSSWYWLAAYITLIIFSGLTDSYWAQHGLQHEAWVSTLFFTLNMSIICGMVVSLFLYFVNLRDKANNELKSLTENLEEIVEARTQELTVTNAELNDQKHELQATLNNLQATQSQLVQSEKMASLGQLIAGIAHEINTPLGAISASIQNISDSLQVCGTHFPNLAKKLTEEELHIFFSIVTEVSQRENQHLTSREERQLKRKLRADLEELGIEEESDTLADTLIDSKVYNLDSIKPLLATKSPLEAINSLYHFSTLVNDSNNVSLAVSKASKVVFALKSFAHRDAEGDKHPAEVINNLETVLTLYQNQMKHGVTIQRNFEQVPMISCYVDELNQVWTNLLHNALQAMNYQGDIAIDVKNTSMIGVTGEEVGAVSVAMKDSGTGIPDRIKDRIFDPFFTTKKQGEGTGLGLDIVSKIIKKHHGTIEVDSEVGQGTTFTVTLPLN